MKMLKILFATLITMTWFILPMESVEINCQYTKDICNVVSITEITQPSEYIKIDGRLQYNPNIPSGIPYNSYETMNAYNYINSLSSKIRVINFDGKYFKYFPNKLMDIFQSAKAIFINGNSSPNLLQDAFSKCGMVEFIQITNGNLPVFPENFILMCWSLKSLYLMNNSISKIDANIFMYTTMLEILDLSHNQITSLPLDLFKNRLGQLSTLNLSHNKITSIPSNLFYNMAKLRSVNLNFNMITSLPSLSAFASMASILSLENNQIQSIAPELCSSFKAYSSYLQITICLNNNPCLLGDIWHVNGYNCDLLESVLKNCYSNWVPPTNPPYNPYGPYSPYGP